MENQFQHSLPSRHKDLLKQLIGGTIQRLARYLYDDVEKIPKDYEIPPHQVFSHFSAPLVLELADGLTLGFNADARQSSLLVWAERDRDGQVREGASLLANDSLSPLECTDQRFSDPQIAWIVGKAIASVSILIREPESLRHALRAREAGIVLRLRCGRDCVLFCGLHGNSEEISVIFRDDIPMHVQISFQELRLSED